MSQRVKYGYGCAVFLAVLLFAGCLGSAKKKSLDVAPLKGVRDLEEIFLKHYQPVE